MKLLIFHPIIAPYRIDFFNSLAKEFDTKVCLTWRNLHDQTFDYANIEKQFTFTPEYLDKRILKVIPKGIIHNIKKHKPDIVLVPECGIVSILVLLYRWATRSNYKVVSMIDDSFDMINGNQFSKKHELAEQILIPHFDNIICVDYRATEHFQKKYSKGIYFPIIYDETRMRERYQRILPISEKLIKHYSLEGKKVILFVGRMVEVKNVPTLIKAFKQTTNEDYRLILVGDGDCKEKWTSLAIDDKRILFIGRREGDELYAWYLIANVFVLPSIQEPFGAVTAEALLGGCWCLVSTKAGSQCLIQEDINGNVFQFDDIQRLVNLLELVLQKQNSISLPLQLRENKTGVIFNNEIQRLIKEIAF